ncbi:hypothetical protein FNV43_RR12940 [Rhamnella rubrinervis]|uniref:glucose-6-phosphate dehydrogenase (NADP(+)) n=1 Tax=Rhamnella rubrinervis TaxID=2594499 RepID=A0A8K0MEL6_9ROSA|nr:hypothetical protein FNV43_RR12940 [Rhamnella rubrinervis]
MAGGWSMGGLHMVKRSESRAPVYAPEVEPKALGFEVLMNLEVKTCQAPDCSPVIVKAPYVSEKMRTDVYEVEDKRHSLAGNPLAKELSEPRGEGLIPFPEQENVGSSISITVVGASGDLAKKKIFPALFALYYEDCLPEIVVVFDNARTKMNDEELTNTINRTLTCKIDKRENCEDKMDQFLQRCFYHSGHKWWTRVIVEKPFGHDSVSSGELTRCLKRYIIEDQTFRIDHYLGKELVENLSVLRFSNLVFQPLWSGNYIRNVQLIFYEDFADHLILVLVFRYFDNYGIIRDIMQNHLLQILVLFSMETPVSLDAKDIRNEKVKVLRSMSPLHLEDVVAGQYKGHNKGGMSYPAYTDDPTVPKDSLTPTFAAATLFINNARWDGVPFLMKVDKARHTKQSKFSSDMSQINSKIPGLGMRLDRSDLNLLYRGRYSREIPYAYERLLLDAIEGERRLFIRSDELDAAWSLFTPLLKKLEEKKIVPELYPYGSRGPVGAHYLAAKYNVRWEDLSGDD